MIGLAAAQIENEDLETLLRICQQKLFLIGSELASDDRGRRMLKEKITAQDALQLEHLIDAFSERLPVSKEFQIPGRR